MPQVTEEMKQSFREQAEKSLQDLFRVRAEMMYCKDTEGLRHLQDKLIKLMGWIQTDYINLMERKVLQDD